MIVGNTQDPVLITRTTTTGTTTPMILHTYGNK